MTPHVTLVRILALCQPLMTLYASSRVARVRRLKIEFVKFRRLIKFVTHDDPLSEVGEEIGTSAEVDDVICIFPRRL